MRTIILGGGLSGLSAAWYAWKRNPNEEILLLEKTERLGGLVETRRDGGLQFERGPRTLARARSPALLELIDELGLSSEIMPSLPAAERRYLLHRGKLRPLGSFWPLALAAAVREVFCTPAPKDDESIYEFAARRFGRTAARRFFDPLTLGIYAGDIQTLSIRSCFPTLWESERTHGSVVRALFNKRRGPSGLFTLKGGLERLIGELKRQLPIEMWTHCSVEALEGDIVRTSRGLFQAGRIISALPAYEISRLAGIPLDIPYRSIWVVQFGFDKKVLRKRGFGYLVPSLEGEPLLGMVWDSEIVQSGANTQLTAMIRSDAKDPADAVRIGADALRRHLQIEEAPTFVSCYFAKQAIPQMEVGHTERLARFREEIARRFPTLRFAGNYISGPSLEECVQTAKRLR